MTDSLARVGKAPTAAVASGIYEILNTLNGKRYIGSAVNLCARVKNHKQKLNSQAHRNEHLQRAWNKYGAPAFVFKPILFCAANNLLMYEQRCLDGYGPEYNICPVAGSSLGMKHTVEAKEKIAFARSLQRGRPLSLEHRQAIAAGLAKAVRPKQSPISRAKISASLRGRRNGPHSPELREKIAAALRGRKLSVSHRQALSKAKRLRDLRGPNAA